MTTMTKAPSVGTLSLARGGVELRQFFRERTAVAFTFALPVVLLALLGSIFGEKVGDSGITASQLLAAGMIAAGIGSTCFVNLATSITSDREDGTLKRLRGVPMPPVAYFVGKVVLVLVTAVVEVAILLAIAALLYDLPLPTDVGRWVTFAWVFVLGVIGCSLLGTAMSSVPRSTRAAAPIVNLPYLVLQFLSGIFIVPITQLPDVLQKIGAVFPLKWMAQGFRSVFLPDSATSMESAGGWEHGRIALVLGAWCIGGFVLCLTTFRWQGQNDG